MSTEDETATEECQIVVDKSKSVIVVADTHLGVKNSASSRPLILSSFLNWVISLKNRQNVSVKLGEWGKGKDEKVLKPPQELILLGDILELWDATDRSIDACSRSIVQSLAKMHAKTTYILGNHDYDLVELIRKDHPEREIKEIDKKYPLGQSELLLFDRVYPPQQNTGKKSKKPCIRTLHAGNENYLFLHGHQFDRLFTLPSWKWMAPFRSAALAFGSYTWILVSLFFLDLILSVWYKGIRLDANGIPGLILLILLACVSIPFLIIKFGRTIWNKIRTRKYKRKGGLQGFVSWWKTFSKVRKKPVRHLNVVYGHTHITDVVDSPDELMEISGKQTSFEGCLLNLPAWMKDLSKEREEVLQAVFLYIDEEGYWFFGWDWGEHQPFLIPRLLIKNRRQREPISEETASKLKDINWPDKLIEEWKKPALV